MITTKNMIDHRLSEQVQFFLVFIHVIPGAWSISKCCPNSIRISSWLRRNSHCGERRSRRGVLYPYIRSGTISCHVTAFFYIESVPGCIFSTQTRSADISSKINCWEWLVESETKTSAVTWQHANYHSWNSVDVQCFPGFTRIKLSNAAHWYMWNITDILPDESCVDMTKP